MKRKSWITSGLMKSDNTDELYNDLHNNPENNNSNKTKA